MCCVEIWLGFARARTGVRLCQTFSRLSDSLMGGTLLSSPVVLVWSVDELQASEGQTKMSCDP